MESSTVAVTVSEIEEIVTNESKIESFSETGTDLVDVELTTTFKWEGLHPESSRPGIDSKRCLKKGWGAVCKGVQTEDLWSKEEQLLHIHVLEHLAIKLALLTFTKLRSIKSIHFQIENKAAIFCPLKIGITTNQAMIALSKEI